MNSFSKLLLFMVFYHSSRNPRQDLCLERGHGDYFLGLAVLCLLDDCGKNVQGAAKRGENRKMRPRQLTRGSGGRKKRCG